MITEGQMDRTGQNRQEDNHLSQLNSLVSKYRSHILTS